MKHRRQMSKRVISLIMVFAMLLALAPAVVFAADAPAKLYLKPNSNWLVDNARFAAYFFGNGETWVSMTDLDGDGIYEAAVPSGYPSVIFCRMSSTATANNWNNKWNQTADLTIPTDGTNLYTVKNGTWDKGGGTWSAHTPAVEEETTEETITVYFRNDWLWPEVYVNYWNESQGSVWPGDLMTKVGTDSNYDVYTAEIPTWATTLVFNGLENGNESNRQQTPNVTGFADGDAYYIHWAGEDMVSKFTYSPSGGEDQPSEPVTWATIHYRNTALWSNVHYHAWLENGASDTGLTSWPGVKITEEEDHINWYTVELTELDAAGGIGILFNDGGNGGQTEDIMITKSGEYWYDDGLLTEAPETWSDGSVATVQYSADLHFANTLNWGDVYLYTWGTGGTYTGAWPGSKAGLDSDGFYTMSLTWEGPEGQGLNFIFSGGGQTVDLAIPGSAFTKGEDGVYTAEKWVVPTTADTEGKYYCDIVDNPGAIAVSPVVDGSSVTLAYKDEYAASVIVKGDMSGDNWATAYEMTRNDCGVWSVTIDNLPGGIYEYKFVVNYEGDTTDHWETDPRNGWQQNGNSAFLISDPNQDTNIITVNVHFDAPSAEWNVCAWGAPDMASQYNFTNGVAAITLNGRASQYVAFKVRKSIEGNKWAEQSGQIRVSLADIVSGTIDVYVGSDFSSSQSLNDDVVIVNKISSVELDYDKNVITIQTAKMVNDPETAFDLYKDGASSGIVTGITSSGSTYTLTLSETLDLVNLYRYTVRFSEQVKFADYDYPVGITTVYGSTKFGNEFTYDGDDLGAVWTSGSTAFRLWAPTAVNVAINLYESGTAGTEDLIEQVVMTKDVDGTWVATVNRDLNGVYYTYSVTRNGKTVEAVDPYARTTGVNGNRGMIIDLDSTDPDDWANDTDPNPLSSYTDAIIYELHVRDFSIDDSSGVKDEWKGKYMAFTQTGTTSTDGITVTGLDYLKSMGFTHLHLLPVYDYGSVDETTCSNFNWGYDPVNYNVPEGSYSTDPYNGEVRVAEFKEMVSSLHDNDISVVMDVVYNHVYDAGMFCMNQIVPGYFSRQNSDGSYSDGSGCGNDTASEREMVRKYIVDSVNYWADEYHVDGFRFDLVGLLDVTTINMIVDTVHENHPGIIFYGEGWTMGTAVEPGNSMATQGNSSLTPEFAYFSDTMRNLLAGDNGKSLGFVSGLTGKEEAVANSFMAKPGWTSNPKQIIQYVSCHDNHTLVDKLILSTGKSGIDSEIIRMNNLAAAIYMTSQGVPFIHAGEEFLREKLEEDGGRSENSYNASDFVNHIEWSNLEKDTYASNSAYYKGLIEFRKAHEALRLETSADITANVKYTWITNEVVMFTIDGTNVEGEISDAIVVIFNANKSAKTVALPDGDWSVCVNGTQAGTKALSTATGSVSVDGISAMVLVQGATEAPEEEEPDVTATITQKGRNLEYKDMIYVIDIFELTGVDGIDLTTDAGILVWSQEEYAALNGNIVYDEAHAKPGLESYPARPEYYFGKSDGIFTRDLYKTAWYAGYVKLPDGTYVYSEAKEYGPETYAYKMLTSGTEETKALCVALLNYISAAQRYFDSSTPDSELVNYELTAEQKALTWDNPELNLAATEIPAGKDVVRDKTVFEGRGKNLLFEEMISLVSVYVIDTATVEAAQECGTIFWTAEQFEALTGAPSFENYGDGTKVTGFNVYQSTDGQWYSAAPAVAPKDMSDTEYYILGYLIDADGEVHYSGVMSYTFEQYIANMANNANMGEFAKRLYYYERAVKAALG